MELDEFIDREPLVLNKNDSLAHYVRLIEKTGIDKAVVTESGKANGKSMGGVIGVITSRDLLVKLVSERLRLSSLGRLRVSGFMSAQPFIINHNSTLESIVKAMSSKSIGIIPVVDEDELTGVIYRRSLLRLVYRYNDPASLVANRNYIRVRVDDSLLMLRQSMINRDESFAVVVGHDEDVIGYITITDVAYAFATFLENIPERHRKEKINKLIVGDYYRQNPLVVSDSMDVGKVAQLMDERGTRAAIVLDGENKVIGLVREHDLISYLALKTLGILQ